MELTRRDALRALATSAAAAAGMVAVSNGTARASGLGTLLDYSAAVPSAASVRAGGYAGVIRYCSKRRPGAEWMAAKPLRRSEADAMRAAGLQIVSCYQYGKGDTSDWLGGYDAGVHHAGVGLALHRAAGGPDGAPIYMSIDSNPSPADVTDRVLPFLRGCESVLGHEGTGVYCNAPTIDRALDAGLGAFFWQHDWGSGGRIHPAAHLHQRSDAQGRVDGIEVDFDTILRPHYGQWSQAGTGGGGGLPFGSDGAPDIRALADEFGGSVDVDALLRDAPSAIERITSFVERAMRLGPPLG